MGKTGDTKAQSHGDPLAVVEKFSREDLAEIEGENKALLGWPLLFLVELRSCEIKGGVDYDDAFN